MYTKMTALYHIRIATDIDTILPYFTNAQRFEVGDGKLDPKPSASAEAIQISVNADESYTGTAIIGIVVVDENNNTGKVSNVVSILVAKGFCIEVEEVAYYTQGMFDANTDVVYEEYETTTTEPTNN
ncbi:hypothetical protein DPMN_143810 [Dreissena polymorpha]|uniref:Uncharacterized protein n=1 Tax=Dreissena polymorpha TaxID=45954 RepID=A0A9D4GEF3_DREPO|nr:hypothetical protein DPMN_143810 [Dreissena polymorpha]